MLVRSKTKEYNRFRNLFKNQHEIETYLQDSTKMNDQDVLIPIWNIIIPKIEFLIEDIETEMKKLDYLLEKDNIIFSKDDFNNEIESQLNLIKKLFKEATKQISKIDLEYTSQEDILKKNMKISWANKLDEHFREFDIRQRKYLFKKRKENLNKEEKYEEYEYQKNLLLTSKNLNQEEMNDILYNFENIEQRDKELQEILISLEQTQDIVKEISNLVIHQGTLLDRIDISLDTQDDLIQKTTKTLLFQEKCMNCNRWTFCILIILFIFFTVLLALIIKIAIKYGPDITIFILKIVAIFV